MKRRLSLLTVTSLLAVTSALIGAGPNAQWVGVLWTKGAVSIGDARVSSGATVLPGDIVTTSEGASAWIRFRSPASTILLADTQVALLASNSVPSLELRHGTMVVDQKIADPVQVVLPGGHVLVKGEADSGAECEMASVGNVSTISVKRGIAEIHGMGAPLIVRAGQSARLEAGPQAGGQPVAGKIYKEMPKGVIQHQGQTQEIPMKLDDQVKWNDQVRTLEEGRAQIMLIDGSTLNVGARSTLKVIKHDPQTQQTELELTMGKVQADVQKITTPGGKFELHTKSAVIGTIDTSYVAETDGNKTKVCGVNGTTIVKSSDPNITKTVTLKKNYCAIILFGEAPGAPFLDPASVADLIGQTSIVGGATAGATAVGTGVLAAIGAGAGAAAGLIVGEVVIPAPGVTSPVVPVP